MMISRNGMKNVLTLAIVLGIVVAFSGSARAQLLVYEPFNYAAETIVNTTPATGTGLTGVWTSNQTGNNCRFTAPSLNYGALPTLGNKLHFEDQVASWAQVSINPAALTGKLDDGDALWFSVIANGGGASGWALGMRFKIGTDTDNAIGFDIGRTTGATRTMRAATWIGGVETLSPLNYTYTNNPAPLVVGRIVFGAALDRIEIYMPAEDLVLPAAPIAVLIGDFDQSTFGMLRLEVDWGPTSTIDEVRIGETPENVGVTVPATRIPNAFLTTPPSDVVVGGGTSHSFLITYGDEGAIDGSTIGIEDITVTGPRGPVTIRSAVASPVGDFATINVTYTLIPPGGTWTMADNGHYEIAVAADEVLDKDAIPNSVPAVTLGGFDVSLGEPNAMIYEPFDYQPDESNINGKNGGQGFTGPWVSTTSGGGRIYWIHTSGLSFSTLPVAGKALTRYGSMGRAQANRLLSPASQAALTADNTTIWFSQLLAGPGANRNAVFLFSTDPIKHTANPYELEAAGEAFGVTIADITGGVGGNGDGSINAVAYDNSITATSFVPGTYTPSPTTAVSLIAGKINWKPNGTPDEFFLFNITDLDNEPAEATAFASITNADMDQSLFDMIALYDGTTAVTDEIRFGASFADVMGGMAPPPLEALIDPESPAFAPVGAQFVTTGAAFGGSLTYTLMDWSFEPASAPGSSIAPDGIIVPGTGISQLTLNPVNSDHVGTYTLLLEDNAGASASASLYFDLIVAPTLTSITVADPNPAGNADPNAYTNQATNTVTLLGLGGDRADDVFLSEAADFSTSVSIKHFSGTVYTYTFDPATNGSKTVYAKLNNVAGDSAVSSASIFLDLDAPTVTVDSLLTTDSTPLISGTFTESGGSGIQSFEVTVDNVAYPITPGAGVWSVVLGALADGTYEVQALITDNAGNSVVDDSSNELAIDATAPTIPLGIVLDDPTPTANDAVDFSVDFSENVNLTLSDVTTGGLAGVALAITGGPQNYTVTATPADPGANGAINITVNAGVLDSAGNPLAAPVTSADYTIDNTATSIDISAPSTPLTGPGPVTFTITYLNVTTVTLTAGDITLNVTGSAAAIEPVGLTGSGLGPFEITLSGITGDGTLGIHIPAASGSGPAGDTPAADSPTFQVSNERTAAKHWELLR